MPGEIVLVAGKGHETYQMIGDTVVPYDDRDHARNGLQLRGGARPGRGGPQSIGG